MSDIDKVLYTSIIAYIIAMIVLVTVKPKFMYDDENKKFKSFGFSDKETIFAMPVVGMGLCISIYLFVIIYTFMMLTLK